MDLLTEKVWLKPDGFAEVQEVFLGDTEWEERCNKGNVGPVQKWGMT